jgi:hypothetical protein
VLSAAAVTSCPAWQFIACSRCTGKWFVVSYTERLYRLHTKETELKEEKVKKNIKRDKEGKPALPLFLKTLMSKMEGGE